MWLPATLCSQSMHAEDKACNACKPSEPTSIKQLQAKLANTRRLRVQSYNPLAHLRFGRLQIGRPCELTGPKTAARSGAFHTAIHIETMLEENRVSFQSENPSIPCDATIGAPSHSPLEHRCILVTIVAPPPRTSEWRRPCQEQHRAEHDKRQLPPPSTQQLRIVWGEAGAKVVERHLSASLFAGILVCVCVSLSGLYGFRGIREGEYTSEYGIRLSRAMFISHAQLD